MKKLILILALSPLLMFINKAEAALISVSDTYFEFGITGTDQNGFVWNFSNLLPTTGPVTFNVFWERMDLDSSDEVMSIFAEGTLVGSIQGGTCGSTPNGAFFGDCSGSATFVTSLGALLSDSILSLTSTQTDVDSSGGPQNNSTFGFVRVNVSYESVPEPSTLAILALGMIGLGARRFKK
jgi:hypothetical protein